MGEVHARPGDLVQKAAEEVGVLGLLEKEGGQVHLLFQPPFGGNGHDEGQDVGGHRFLAGLKE